MKQSLADVVEELACEARAAYSVQGVECELGSRGDWPGDSLGVYDSGEDKVYIRPERVCGWDRVALRWLVFHEFGHALDCRIARKARLYCRIWNEKIVRVKEDGHRKIIGTIFNDLQDYNAEKRLKSLQIPWPQEVRADSFLRNLKRFECGEISEQSLRSNALQRAIRIRALLDFSILSARARKAVERLWEATGLAEATRQDISRLLSALAPHGPETWLEIFPRAFRLVGPYSIRLVRKKVRDIKELDPEVDFWMTDEAQAVRCFEVHLRCRRLL